MHSGLRKGRVRADKGEGMIYQFNLLGRLVASHKSYMDAAKWVQERTFYDVRNPLFGGLE